MFFRNANAGKLFFLCPKVMRGCDKNYLITRSISGGECVQGATEPKISGVTEPHKLLQV